MTRTRDDGSFVEPLLSWWRREQRELPWRDVRDPWAILVSETMAQQTQVDRVIPKWRAFMRRFPSPGEVASSPVSEVIRAWDGLGYNRRAVLLHRCAVELVARHDGRVPDDLDELLGLPGIGPYTARAIQAFAFEQDVAVVDTNVGRVLARVDGAPLRPREVQDLADSLVPTNSGWTWNQALLDFGAIVCTKRSPSCSACPVSPRCAWGGVGPDPAIGSAAVSAPQSRFEGSDRQGRGRLVRALRQRPVPIDRVAAELGWPDDLDRADRALERLVSDGLVEVADTHVRLVD